MVWLYSILKHSQVSYNNAEPFDLSLQFKNIKCEEEKEVKIELNDVDLTLKKEQEEIEIKQKYERIISDAKSEAERIINEAKAQSEHITKVSEKKGFDKGINLANKKCDEAMGNLLKLETELKQELENKVTEFKDNILNLSFLLSEKIINIECDKKDNVILDTLNGIINKFRDEKNITVEVSKNNFDKLVLTDLNEECNIRYNEEFGETDVHIALENGIIDASIDVQ